MNPDDFRVYYHPIDLADPERCYACGHGPGWHRILKGNCPGIGAEVVERRRARDLWARSFWIAFPDGVLIGPFHVRVVAESVAGFH